MVHSLLFRPRSVSRLVFDVKANKTGTVDDQLSASRRRVHRPMTRWGGVSSHLEPHPVDYEKNVTEKNHLVNFLLYV